MSSRFTVFGGKFVNKSLHQCCYNNNLDYNGKRSRKNLCRNAEKPGNGEM